MKKQKWDHVIKNINVDTKHNKYTGWQPGGYTTNLAEHTQAFLGKPGSTEPQLAIRVKWYHEAHFRFN